ncbi:hypothetical protein Mx9_p22 [Myxococcus phage Mx9]|nr:hypothetical protein Mx9_p22 [Myxococcus phage Mx9]
MSARSSSAPCRWSSAPRRRAGCTLGPIAALAPFYRVERSWATKAQHTGVAGV